MNEELEFKVGEDEDPATVNVPDSMLNGIRKLRNRFVRHMNPISPILSV